MMFELPEFVTLAGQINETLTGRVIRQGQLGNTPHKFVWYNRSPSEFERLTEGKTIGAARAKGKWLFVALEPGYLLLFGECGGKMLYHPPEAGRPTKYHLRLEFADSSGFTVTTQMWGAMELYEAGQEQNRQYVKGMRPTPLEPEFTFDYFSALIATDGKKRSAKSHLTQDQLIPGLGNAIAQDILFRAKMHPRHPAEALTKAQQRKLYTAIIKTVQAVILIRPGAACAEIDQAANGFLREQGYGAYLLHRTGHGFGLGNHEGPWVAEGSPDILAENMLISVEPGIYIPNLGGFRHSDTVLVTAGGYESLTRYPDSLEHLTLGRGNVLTRLNGALVRKAVGL